MSVDKVSTNMDINCQADVEWTGEGGIPSLYRSSETSPRAFCPSCGSSMGALR